MYLLIPETVYRFVRDNPRTPNFIKGFFAQAIISYHRIRTDLIKAGWKHIGFMLLFCLICSLIVLILLVIAIAVLFVGFWIVLGLLAIAITIGVVAATLSGDDNNR